MASKIFVLFALLALLVSAATAYIVPQCSSPLSTATVSTIPQYFPWLTATTSAQSFVQSYRQQQAFASVVSPLLAMTLQQPFVFPQQTIQGITALHQQQQLLPYLFNQLAVANPAVYWQQEQQLLPYLLNHLSVVNPAAYWQQQQQLLPYLLNQLSVVNPAAYWQQQQLLPYLLNQLSVANPAAYWQQQSLLPFNQLAQQLLPFNQLAAINSAAFLQQPIIGGACF